MTKRLILLSVILLLGWSFSGCNGQMEIDRVSFPVALGIDYLEASNSIKVYAQILNTPSGTTGGQGISTQKTFEILDGEGDTLLDAMADVTSKGSQNISWKHITVVLLSSRMARHGISSELDLLCRFQQIHMNSFIIATEEPLTEVLDAKPKLESSLPAPLTAIRLVSNQSSHTKAVTIREFVIAYLNDGVEPVIPLVKTSKNAEGEVVFDYPGLGFFCDDKLIDILDEEETKGAVLVFGRKNISRLSIPEPTGGKEKEFTVRSIHSMPTIIPYFYTGKPGIKINIEVEYILAETTIKNKTNTRSDESLNKKVEEYVKESAESAISKSQKESSDVFGFGEEFHRKYPKYWSQNKDRWAEILQTLPVTVQVRAKLKNTGETLDSMEYLHQKD